jgi:hypothetical protein
MVHVLALTALLSVPLAADGQDQQPAPGPRGRSGFMMSARLMTPWSPFGADEAFNGVVALPRFVVGAQLKDLGVGAGLNIFSWDNIGILGGSDATIFLFGPTITYAVAKGPGGRTQLHLLGSLSFGMGSASDVDITAIGFDFGVIGRALLIENFGMDVGVVFDFLSVNFDPPDPRDDDETDRGVQIVGFLGGTFIL